MSDAALREEIEATVDGLNRLLGAADAEQIATAILPIVDRLVAEQVERDAVKAQRWGNQGLSGAIQFDTAEGIAADIRGGTSE